MWAARSCRTRPGASVLSSPLPTASLPPLLSACLPIGRGVREDPAERSDSPRNRITPKPNYNPHLALRRLDLREDRGGERNARCGSNVRGEDIRLRYVRRTDNHPSHPFPISPSLRTRRSPSPSCDGGGGKKRPRPRRSKANESVRRQRQVMLLLMCICCCWLVCQ